VAARLLEEMERIAGIRYSLSAKSRDHPAVGD